MASGFDLNVFQANIAKNGVLRTSKFLVRFPLPNTMAGDPSSSVQRYLELWAEATNIPGVILATGNVTRYGYGAQEKKPFAPQNADVNCSFISDGNGAVWTFFQKWMKTIVNYDLRAGVNASTGWNGATPFEVAYKADYVSDINIQMFDDTGVNKLSIILREAFPIFVGDIQLHWSDQNNIVRVPVSFTFLDWYNDNVAVNTSQTTTTITQPASVAPDSGLFSSGVQNANSYGHVR